MRPQPDRRLQTSDAARCRRSRNCFAAHRRRSTTEETSRPRSAATLTGRGRHRRPGRASHGQQTSGLGRARMGRGWAPRQCDRSDRQRRWNRILGDLNRGYRLARERPTPTGGPTHRDISVSGYRCPGGSRDAPNTPLHHPTPGDATQQPLNSVEQVRRGRSRCGVDRTGAAWTEQVRRGPNWCGVDRTGAAVDPTGAAWTKQVRRGPSRCGVDRAGAAWTKQVRRGPSRCGVDRAGAAWTEQVRREPYSQADAVRPVANGAGRRPVPCSQHQNPRCNKRTRSVRVARSSRDNQ